MSRRWFSTQTGPHEAQVHPENDLNEHELSEACWCQPRVDRAWHGSVIIHNSLDGRENDEPTAAPRPTS